MTTPKANTDALEPIGYTYKSVADSITELTFAEAIDFAARINLVLPYSPSVHDIANAVVTVAKAVQKQANQEAE